MGIETTTLQPFLASSTDYEPPLRSRGNIVTSHAAGPVSIPGRVSFLVDVFFLGFFPQPLDKCQEIWATIVPCYHGYHIAYHPKPFIIRLRTATRRSLTIAVAVVHGRRLLTNKQQQRAGLSLQTQEPRLHFFPKADLPLQTKVAVLLGINRCRNYPLLSATISF